MEKWCVGGHVLISQSMISGAYKSNNKLVSILISVS
jgi:hypothetical protein